MIIHHDNYDKILIQIIIMVTTISFRDDDSCNELNKCNLNFKIFLILVIIVMIVNNCYNWNRFAIKWVNSMLLGYA